MLTRLDQHIAFDGGIDTGMGNAAQIAGLPSVSTGHQRQSGCLKDSCPAEIDFEARLRWAGDLELTVGNA